MLVYLNILAAVMVAGLLSVVISSINRDIEHQLQHISSTLSIARSGDPDPDPIGLPGGRRAAGYFRQLQFLHRLAGRKPDETAANE